MNSQVKFRQRIADYGEVFTADREVKAMCDLVKQEAERIDSRFKKISFAEGLYLCRACQCGGTEEKKKGAQQTLFDLYPETKPDEEGKFL